MRNRVKRIFRYIHDGVDLVVFSNSTDPHIDLSFMYVAGLTDGLFEGCGAFCTPDGGVEIVTSALEEEAAKKSGLPLHVFRTREENLKLIRSRLRGHRRRSALRLPGRHFGEADLRNVSPANQYLANMDLLFELNTVTSAQFWRFSFDPNTGAPIEIGNIVGMQLYKVAKNPTVQQFSHDYEREIRQLRAAGGALHVWRGARHVNYSADYIFTRIDDAQATQLHDIFRLYGDRLVGFKAPNQAAYVLPYAMPHFYGRMEGFHVMPEQGATATTHLNTVTTRFTHGW